MPNYAESYPEAQFSSAGNYGLAERMMENQSFVDSLNHSHNWLNSKRQDPLVVANLNI